MRISTAMLHEFSLRAMQTQQEAIFKTQHQVSSGRRILTPSDAPVDAVRILEGSQSLDRIRQFQRNLGLGQGELNQQDVIFGDVHETLLSVRDLALQMNNASMSSQNRADGALVVRGRLEYLISLANGRDTTGSFLFSGFKGDTKPFVVDGAGNVQYNGDQGARMLRVGENRELRLAENGDALFMQIPSGNGTFAVAADPGNIARGGTGTFDAGSVVNASLWTRHDYSVTFAVAAGVTTYTVRDNVTGVDVVGPGAPYQSGGAIQFDGIELTIQGDPAHGDVFTVQPSTDKNVFAILKELADALAVPASTPAEKAALNNAVSIALTELNQAMDHFTGARARVGDRLNSVDGLLAAYADRTFLYQENISKLQDADYAEAISNLTRQMQSLEASQKAYAATKGLSLFNYI